ncbi:MAG: Asp-tRNA Asn/Glu-tRNA Gln amidotransferase subunit B [candidate division WS6 bacterium 36_33]|uniref:Aspartyl/glutamyl-tRNA(Asn/Gln) amidotransferase subunit B n=1 Tax=candidate division WS6 bacterium 36_33 TaxID=1641388 RepID=A0A101GZ52_9BACT|nr:MAG: Asp-tRNA Asn/Glu-tRNA Gln amidotransferase subunit B [candidate division WS6 bacterium 36_33]
MSEKLSNTNLKNRYDLIVGLEIHIQTNTSSKMFCSCPTGYFQEEPNTHVCPVCLGLPGALPVPNKRALELCILMGLALNCDIDREIRFDRKHYFYPDLPKGYQISQYKRPICSDGYVETVSGVKIDIERIHQEEDVAKSTHHIESSTGKQYSLIDYNKSGVPLIEIVTKPCIRTAKDAKDFATEIRKIARYLGISDADMEKGQMRCEPNISIQEKGKWEYKEGQILPLGDYKLNPKVEVKNIGSITAVEKSIQYEVERLTKELEEGKEIKQQTRGWNADKNITEYQRTKETADDYRYMPEPDIPVIEISDEDVERISEELVELPVERMKRYIEELGLSEYAAEVISSSRESAEYFENLYERLKKDLNEKDAALEASNWLMGPVFALSTLDVEIEDLALLISAFKKGDITKNKAEELLNQSVKENKDLSEELDKVIQQKEELTGNLNDIVKEVLQKNTKAVEDYKGGKESTLGFLVGQVMQSTKGAADPNEVRSILIKELK